MPNEERVVGATIADKYRVVRIIGTGAMGLVCEALHVEIGKRVAIKLIDASLAGMTDIAARFRQEARATSLIESDHIVQVFDVGTDPSVGLYLVMEHLNGEDLAKHLAREQRLSPDAAVRIATQVARGLAKAHGAGIVHRDIKPANTFLCTSDAGHPLVKILDFGISKVFDSSVEASGAPRGASGLALTRDGTAVGTPQYMSPEQAQGFAVDARTDVWSLGLVFYEMLAGRPAYPELPTYEQFIAHLVSNPPDPLSAVAPWVPVAIASVVHDAIEHDLGKRIQSSKAFLERLDSASGSRRRLSSPNRAQPRDGFLASSGVENKGVSSESDDFTGEAPEFFDRKLLRTLAQASPTIGACEVGPSPLPIPMPARREPMRGRTIGWVAGFGFLAIGLAVAVALAWR